MTVPARLELSMWSDAERLPALRNDVRAWLAGRGWPERQANEVVLALDEAVTNVICHGYGGRKDCRIEVTLEGIEDAVDGAGVEVRVRDFGRQVDPATICGRDLEDIRPGGLGVHIIKAMNNTVEYQRAEGGGMLLIMRKFRSHVAEANSGKGRCRG